MARPSKLTPEVTKRLTEAIRAGNYYEAACGYAGIGYSTFRVWMTKGEKAKSMGIMTWASLEPVIEPEQSLEIIRRAHGYVDLFKVGTLNHHPRAREIDWHKFAADAVRLLRELNCSYYIKDDLRRHLTKTA